MRIGQARALIGKQLRHGRAVDADTAGKGALADVTILHRAGQTQAKLRGAVALVDFIIHVVINIMNVEFC